MGGSEVGPVAAEDVDPLAVGVVEVLGDEVGGVVLAAAGHRDVRRRGAGVLPNEDVRGFDGLALGAVNGGGVGELDEPGRVLGGNHPIPAAPTWPLPVIVEDEAPVVPDTGHRPGLPVRDLQVGVVATGRDPIPEPDAIPGGRTEGPSGAFTVLVVVADDGVEIGDLLAGVRDDQVTRDAGVGDRGGPFDLGAVDDDLSALEEGVEDGGGVLAGAQPQAEVGVRGIGEPVHALERDHRGGVREPDRVIQDPSAADSGELVPVPDQRQPRAGLIRESQKRTGDVLVEHPRLVDQQKITGTMRYDRARKNLDRHPNYILAAYMASGT